MQCVPERCARRTIVAKGVAACEQPVFAQQPARARGEPRKIEVPRQWSLRLPRREAVAALDPGFCRQIFEIDPLRLNCLRTHRIQIRRRQAAAECFDNDIGRRGIARRQDHPPDPATVERRRRVHRAGARRRKRVPIIDEQPYRDCVFARQLSRKPPRNARVAEVVDDGTEYVPAFLRSGHGWIRARSKIRQRAHYRAFGLTGACDFRSDWRMAENEAATDARPPDLVVDIVSDVVCPWCYIGKRKLETALAELQAREPGLAILRRWHPFQLNPGPAARRHRPRRVYRSEVRRQGACNRNLRACSLRRRATSAFRSTSIASIASRTRSMRIG